MKKRIYLALIMLVFTLVATGCSISPKGKVVQETIPFEVFEKLSIYGAFQVEYISSDTYEVVLTMQENLFDHTTVAVNKGQLSIKQSDRLNFGKISDINDLESTKNALPKLSIYAPTLTEITLDGFILANNWDALNGDSLTLKTDGVINLELSGQVTASKWEIDGMTNLKALNFQSETATVTIDGMNNVELSVTNELDASIDGMSSLKYRGNPTITKQKIEGLSSLRQVEG